MWAADLRRGRLCRALHLAGAYRVPHERGEAVDSPWKMWNDGSGGAEERVAARLDELFTRDGDRWIPNWRPPLQGLLITWETAGARS